MSYKKAYEAGPEKRIVQRFSERPPKWDIRDVDRVRLEFNLNLGLQNMPTLHQVVCKPFETLLFVPIQEDREDNSDPELIKFKTIDNRSPQLPIAYDEYLSQDCDGNAQSFQEKVIQGKKKLANVTQYIDDAKEFDWFKNMIWTAVQKNNSWC